MKKKSYLYTLLLCPFFCLCCSESSIGEKIKTLNYEVGAKQDYILTSEFVEKSGIIPLETSDECLIGDIDQIVVGNNLIYISDGATIFKFNMGGKFISKIDKKGMGPDEYLEISSFSIDRQNNVYILSGDEKSIFIYNCENKLNNKISIDFFAKQMKVCDDNTTLLYLGNFEPDVKSKIVRIDNEGNVLNNWIPTNPILANYLHTMPLYPIFIEKENGIAICEPYNDTIYSIQNDTISYDAVINYDGRNMPNDILIGEYSNVMEFAQSRDNSGCVYSLGFFIETNEHCFKPFIYQDKTVYGLYDKKTSRSVSSETIKDDLNFYGFRIRPFCNIDAKTFIAKISATKLMEYAASISHDEQKRIKEEIRYCGDDQNPVLYIGTVK